MQDDTGLYFAQKEKTCFLLWETVLSHQICIILYDMHSNLHFEFHG